MTTSLRAAALLLLLTGCEPGPDAPMAWSGLSEQRWTPVPGPVDDHHATVALTDADDLVVAWSRDYQAIARTWVYDARLGIASELDEVGGSHPQVAMVGDTTLVATHNISTGRVTAWVDTDGLGDFPDALVLDEGNRVYDPKLPDVAVLDDQRALVAWHGQMPDGTRAVAVSGVDAARGRFTPRQYTLPGAIAPVATGAGDGLAAVAAVLGGPSNRSVQVRFETWPPSGGVTVDVTDQVGPPCEALRPGVAVTAGHAVVTWHCEGGRNEAFVAIAAPDGSIPLPATALSTTGCGRTTSVDAAAGLAAVTWEACDPANPVDARIQVALIDVASASFVQPVVTLADPQGRDRRRPDITLEARGPGVWEAALAWQTTVGDATIVQVSGVTLTP